MHIFVKIQNGKVLTLDVELSETIANIKLEIQNKENIPQEQQHLILGGKELQNELTLSDYKVEKPILFLLLIH